MIKIITPGILPYSDGLALQEREKLSVQKGESEGAVIILQHDPPVITLGRRAKTESIPSEDEIFKEGYSIERITRAGDVTVHEPGQAVVYFILPVKSKDSKSFIDSVMDPLIEFFIIHYNIEFEFKNNMPGLWIDDRKICSMGFDLSGGVSMHGISVNVNNSLRGFELVVPCGIDGVKMTSLSLEKEKEITADEFICKLKNFYQNKFNDPHH